MKHEAILKDVDAYYSTKLKEFGPSAKGVDWNSEESQNARFEELVRVIQTTDSFSLLDYGCGYGALCSFMKSRYPAFSYHGYDISKHMIEVAEKAHQKQEFVTFGNSLQDQDLFDYAVSSGLFNVKLEHEVKQWNEYVLHQIHALASHSTKGFAFNMLTSYSDPEYMREDLFYADPCYMFDYCKRHFSNNVSLLHDYQLYEFTIVVRL